MNGTEGSRSPAATTSRKPPLGPPRSESGGLEAPLQQLSPRLAALKSAKEQCATQECHGRTFALLQAVQGLSEQAESSTTNTGSARSSKRRSSGDASSSFTRRKKRVTEDTAGYRASDAASEDDDAGEFTSSRSAKRPRLIWTNELHARFVNAVNILGLNNAVPKTILHMMNVDGLTRENVASHLQKYRIYLKRLAEYSANAHLIPSTLHQFQLMQHVNLSQQATAQQGGDLGAGQQGQFTHSQVSWPWGLLPVEQPMVPPTSLPEPPALLGLQQPAFEHPALGIPLVDIIPQACTSRPPIAPPAQPPSGGQQQAADISAGGSAQLGVNIVDAAKHGSAEAGAKQPLGASGQVTLPTSRLPLVSSSSLAALI